MSVPECKGEGTRANPIRFWRRTPRTYSKNWIVAEKDLDKKQKNIVRENIYDAKGRIESVTKKIETSNEILE